MKNRRTKYLWKRLTVMMLVFFLLCQTAVPAFAAEETEASGLTPAAGEMAHEEEAADLSVATAGELKVFRDAVNAGDRYEGKTVRLTANIDLAGSETDQWTPITGFAGTFDGDGHVISGLYINTSAGSQGLFGTVTAGGAVRNLTVRGSVTGGSSTGGLIGSLTSGTVENCQSSVTVNGSSNVGGLVGTIGGTSVIRTSANYGEVRGTVGYVGGIAALTAGSSYTIENCFNAGTVAGPASVGGISSGSRSGSPTHKNCYNYGMVEVTGTGSGSNVGAISGSGRGSITNCYYLTGTAAGGANGSDAEGATAPKTEAEMKDASFVDLLNAGGSAYTADSADTPVNGGYPVFAWQLAVDQTEPGEPETPEFEEATELSAQLSSYIRQMIDGRRAQNGIAEGESLMGSDSWTAGASSTGTDWFALAMGRYSYVNSEGATVYLYDDFGGYAAYLEAMCQYITDTYAANSGILDRNKATEWQRAAVTILALGGDPTSFGTYNGTEINLVADGGYYCVISPGRQGLNGWIWGLIMINAMDYEVPGDAAYPVETFITQILSRQMADGVNGNAYGGWALSGSSSDPDMTAMAIQALAPYYNSSTEYTYELGGETVVKTVHQAVNEALDWLSENQNDAGDFGSWGTTNVESTAQVLVAVLSLNLDPAADERFITDSGNTLLDGILKYRLADGTFSHTYGAAPNGMATDQAGYALVAYWRYENGMRSLYDFRAPRSQEAQAAINAAETAISSLPAAGTEGYKGALMDAYLTCLAVKETERQYISNYDVLYRAIEQAGGLGNLDKDDPYPVELTLISPPDKTAYQENEFFDPAGMSVGLRYSDGTVTEVTGYTYLPDRALAPEDEEIVIYYQGFSVTVPVTVEEQVPWNGSGTEEDPYLISRAQDLEALSDFVNVKRKNCDGLYFKMTDNINMEDVDDWRPIGTSSWGFNGIFDGGNHAVKNLTYTSGSYAGLFGCVVRGTVKNLGMAGGSFGRSNGSFCGAIVGWAESITMENCWSSASVSGNYTGGLIGTVRGGASTISGCFNSGTVTGSNVGGIVGHLSASALTAVSDCYNVGAVTTSSSGGGICGRVQDTNTIRNCYNTGLITVTGSDLLNLGEICGLVTSGSTSENNYYLAGQSDLTGVGAQEDSQSGCTALTEEDMKASGFPGQLSDRFEADTAGLNGGYPVLTWQPLVNLDTEAKNVDLYITTEEEFLAFAAAVNAGESYEGMLVALTRDMNLAFETWTPIGNENNSFNGTFDGQGFGVSGLLVEASGSCGGLFGVIGADAVIRDTGVNSGSVAAASVAGGLIGRAADGFQILNCWNLADVSAQIMAGGILGSVDTGYVDDSSDPVTSLISGCYNGGAVTASSMLAGGVVAEARHVKAENCYNVGTVTAPLYEGGITGWLLRQGILSNCYNAGPVSRAGVAGSVLSGDNAEVENCYYVSDGFSSEAADGSAGLSAEEMKEESFAERLGDAYRAESGFNNGYPVLFWEESRYVISSDTRLAGVALGRYAGEEVSEGIWQITVPEGVEPMQFGLTVTPEDPNSRFTTPLADEAYQEWNFTVTAEDGTTADYTVYVTVGHSYLDELAAAGVDALIGEIPDTITMESGAAIEAAREAYEALTTLQKDLVRNLEALEAAEAAYSRLVDSYRFVDVPDDAWFAEEVQYVYAHQIMTGTDPERHIFSPYETVARAQFALIIHRMEGEPEAENGKTFPDVSADEWYARAIAWASSDEVGIITGYSSGYFGPSNYVTREQMAVMLYRYVRYKGYDTSTSADLGSYRDADQVSDFALDAMQWAVGAGIISGKYDQTMLEPMAGTSRAEAAVMITRFMKQFQ